jgi:hypothetical protein
MERKHRRRIRPKTKKGKSKSLIEVRNREKRGEKEDKEGKRKSDRGKK